MAVIMCGNSYFFGIVIGAYLLPILFAGASDNLNLYFFGIVTGVIVNLVGIIFVNWYNEYSVKQKLKKESFVGMQWQKDLFDHIVNKSLTEDLKHDLVDGETKNWTEEDLLKFYSPHRIKKFYTNRDQVRDEWRIYKSVLDYSKCKDNFEETSTMMKSIYNKINKLLNDDLLSEINSLQAETPSIDNIEMATAAAKNKKLEDLTKIQDELAEIRKHAKSLKDSVDNYEA